MPEGVRAIFSCPRGDMDRLSPRGQRVRTGKGTLVTFESVRRVRGLDLRSVGFGDFNGLVCSMPPEGGRFLENRADLLCLRVRRQ